MLGPTLESSKSVLLSWHTLNFVIISDPGRRAEKSAGISIRLLRHFGSSS